MNEHHGRRILVTGAAGFIGYHVCRRLLADEQSVTGVDNLNSYYDTRLKEARLGELFPSPGFTFLKIDVADPVGMKELFERNDFDVIIHLAAQVGVRNSVSNPRAYVETNVAGFLNVLEGARTAGVEHIVYASSSSVYGLGGDFPSVETQRCDYPASVYAATKRSSELLANAYSSLYGIAVTGLRFFTVYGPWGRPDMSYFLFTDAILSGRPITVYNNGEMLRDFTYIDDAVEGLIRILAVPPELDAATGTRSQIFNLGGGSPVSLTTFIEALERALGKSATKSFKPMHPADVHTTHADVSRLVEAVGFRPSTSIHEGLAQFASWYRRRYGTPATYMRSAKEH